MESTLQKEELKVSQQETPVSTQDSGASHKRTKDKRLKEGAAHTVQSDSLIGQPVDFKKNPAYIGERKKIFDELIEA